MGKDLFSATDALNLKTHKQPAVVLCFLVLLSLVPVWRLEPRTQAATRPLLILAILSIASIFATERSYSHYSANSANWLHPANIHPVHAFVRGGTDNTTISAAEQEAALIFKQRQRRDSSDLKQKQAYNVIFILLESFRADLTGSAGGGNSNKSLSPNFDSLAQFGMMGEQHFSNTTHTVSAELNLWCSIFDKKGEAKLAYLTQSRFNFTCLPQLLAKAGYTSLYFHGNTGAFYNRSELLPKLGFNELFFYKDVDQPPVKGKKIGWGVDDDTIFDTMTARLSTLSRNEKPFFAHLTTLSNHYPFRGSDQDPDFIQPFPAVAEQNTLFQNYQNMITYTDQALGRFWRSFMASRLAKNTIVVISSDHGIWEFGPTDYSTLEKNERFFRAPLFVYHPNQSLPKTTSGLSSHIDITPTLLNLLGLPLESSMNGQNLLSEQAKDNWVIADKGNETFYRKGQTSCFLDMEECAGRQQECKPSMGEIHLTNSEKSYQTCLEFKGDLFGDFQILSQFKDNPEYDEARHYRSYLNKTLLSK